MNWILIPSLISLSLFLIYNGVALMKFGVPHSLSMTYYCFKEYKDKTKHIFTIMMVVCACLLMPGWIEMSEGSSLQFLTFLSAVGIIFVGLIPEVLNSDFENIVHTSFAILSAIFSMLWVVLVAEMWPIIIMWIILITTISLITKTLKKGWLYWIEMVVFGSVFTSMIIYSY